ncbi:hypothetical protein BMEDGCBD_01759 [Escherichia coli]|nr:hypothetical protein BMEDGCBD_01759 [Escherichia coli]
MRGKHANHKCLIFSNAAGIRTGRYVNSPNYEDIAVVELQLCISLTVTECDIDSVTGEIV